MVHEPSTGEIGGIDAQGGGVLSCGGDRGERDSASSMETHEVSAKGASCPVGGTNGRPRHQPVTFDPHSGSVLSLKVSTCTLHQVRLHVHCTCRVHLHVHVKKLGCRGNNSNLSRNSEGQWINLG